MKSVSIVPSIISPKKFILEGTDIHAGLAEEEDFELLRSADPENRVLVKKRAFSCNYRDKTLILNYGKKILEKSQNKILAFSYIGSEFVGDVIDIGKKVEGFKIGDRVIPNIAYP